MGFGGLTQDFLNLKINQVFEKSINFVCVSFFFEKERKQFDPCFNSSYIFQEFNLKINV